MKAESIVIASLKSAFNAAIAKTGKHPVLEHALAQPTHFLIEDIVEALDLLPTADEILATKATGDIGKSYHFTSAKLRDWIDSFPAGVIWPITVAATLDPGLIAFPMRVLMMVPIGREADALPNLREFAGLVAEKVSPTNQSEFLGPRAAIFVGLSATTSGEWECGSVAAWCVADSGIAEVRIRPLVLDWKVVENYRVTTKVSLKEATDFFIRLGISEEIGIVLGH